MNNRTGVFEIIVNNQSEKKEVLDKINETRLSEAFFTQCRETARRYNKNYNQKGDVEKDNGSNRE